MQHMRLSGHATGEKHAIFDSLAPCDVARLYAAAQTCDLASGDTLIEEGEDLDRVFIVETGALKLRKSTRDGRQQIFAFAFAGDLIGRPFACKFRHGAYALGPSRLLAFPAAEFDRLTRQNPAFLASIARLAFADLDACRRLSVLLGRKHADEKVASFFVELARWQGQAAALRSGRRLSLALPMSRQDMADFLGLTIETVSRQVSAMKDAGMIEFPGRCRVTILDPMAVLETAG